MKRNQILYKAIRKSTAMIAALSAFFFGTVFLLEQQIPSNFYVSPGEELTFSSLSYLKSGTPLSYDQTSLAGKSLGTSEQVTVRLFGLFPVTQTRVSVKERETVTPGGTLFGIKLFTKGVLVIDIAAVETPDGTVYPAAEAGIQKGDTILTIDGTDVFTNEEVADLFCDGPGPYTITYTRDDVVYETTLNTAKGMDGMYKGGLWVRDSTAGIGTVSYYDNDTGAFGGLGHGINDSDTGLLMPLSAGQICPVHLSGVQKGVSGTPGELKGSFSSNEPCGTLNQNTQAGVFGTLTDDTLAQADEVEVLHKQEVKPGDAVIRCTLGDDGIQEYHIRIDEINMNEKALTKNLIITVTDEALLRRTGGIVQGMSGSPILQNGKLLGAVTHVFVNNPTKGYGIFAENMLSVMDENAA